MLVLDVIRYSEHSIQLFESKFATHFEHEGDNIVLVSVNHMGTLCDLCTLLHIKSQTLDVSITDCRFFNFSFIFVVTIPSISHEKWVLQGDYQTPTTQNLMDCTSKGFQMVELQFKLIR